MNNLEKLRACFRAALTPPADTDIDALVYAKHPLWDSVAHMRLVAEIERQFNIMFTTDQILDLNSFAMARELVGGYGIDWSGVDRAG